MPTLKQIKCSIELGPSNTVLKEYGARYSDGHVEAFIAVPGTDVPFTVHLKSEGYIAPGLAFFVFMDGQYQCNRNKVDLKLPGGGVERSDYETEFRLRQKEEKTSTGTFVARDWTFAKLNKVAADKAPNLNAQFTNNVGTIEIIALRCKTSDGDEQPTKALQVERKSAELKSRANGKRSSAAARPAKPTTPQQSEIGGLFGLFDGACDILDLDGAGDAKVGQYGTEVPFQIQHSWVWDAKLHDFVPSDCVSDGSSVYSERDVTEETRILDGCGPVNVQMSKDRLPSKTSAVGGFELPAVAPVNHWKGRSRDDMQGDKALNLQGRSRRGYKQYLRETGDSVSSCDRAGPDFNAAFGAGTYERHRPRLPQQQACPATDGAVAPIQSPDASDVTPQQISALLERLKQGAQSFLQRYQNTPDPRVEEANRDISIITQLQENLKRPATFPRMLKEIFVDVELQRRHCEAHQRCFPESDPSVILKQCVDFQLMVIRAERFRKTYNMSEREDCLDLSLLFDEWIGQLEQYIQKFDMPGVVDSGALHFRIMSLREDRDNVDKLIHKMAEAESTAEKMQARTRKNSQFRLEAPTMQGWNDGVQSRPEALHGQKVVNKEGVRIADQQGWQQVGNGTWNGDQLQNQYQAPNWLKRPDFGAGGPTNTLGRSGQRANANQQVPGFGNAPPQGGWPPNGPPPPPNNNAGWGPSNGDQQAPRSEKAQQWGRSNRDAQQPSKDDNAGWGDNDAQNGGGFTWEGKKTNKQQLPTDKATGWGNNDVQKDAGINWGGNGHKTSVQHAWGDDASKKTPEHNLSNSSHSRKSKQFQQQDNEGWGNANGSQKTSEYNNAGWGAESVKSGGNNDWGGKADSVRKSSNKALPLPSEADQGYIKPYWNVWNQSGSQRDAQNGSSQKQRQEPREAYKYPASTLPAISADKTKDASHGIQTSRGADYMHTCRKPIYIDSMEAPYAVFSFKYRSKEVLEKILKLKIDDVEVKEIKAQVEKDRLMSMPKHKLIEELMNKRAPKDGSKKNPASQANQSAKGWGDNQGTKKDGWGSQSNKGDGWESKSNKSGKAGGGWERDNQASQNNDQNSKHSSGKRANGWENGSATNKGAGWDWDGKDEASERGWQAGPSETPATQGAQDQHCADEPECNVTEAVDWPAFEVPGTFPPSMVPEKPASIPEAERKAKKQVKWTLPSSSNPDQYLPPFRTQMPYDIGGARQQVIGGVTNRLPNTDIPGMGWNAGIDFDRGFKQTNPHEPKLAGAMTWDDYVGKQPGMKSKKHHFGVEATDWATQPATTYANTLDAMKQGEAFGPTEYFNQCAPAPEAALVERRESRLGGGGATRRGRIPLP